ncbi:MAG: extracellular solute-binding protein [Anaerolineales bacterium]
MKEIEFSTMFDTTASPGMGEGFFDVFTARHQVKVNPLHMDWSDSWNQLVRFGLNSHGPDVSEIGTTWLGGLHSMDVLRPLTTGETALLGGERLFPPALWHACQAHQTPNNPMLAIPWTLDLRVVLYRRDWLQKAGVDETTAFADSNQFYETLRRLNAAGHPAPLGLTTSHTNTILIHDMACWVWSAGGDLRSDDGRRMMLMEPESLAGMQAYFGLNEFLSPGTHALAENQVYEDFFTGKTAVAILEERAYLEVVKNRSYVAADAVDNIGLAMLMRVPYIGGSALTIWRHSSDYQDALKLIQYLTSPEAWQLLNQQRNPYYTPARLDLLEQAPLAAIPFYPAIQKSLQNGRSFHSGYRWSAVETRLATVIEQMWNDLRANPGLNIAREVEQRFFSVCNRLEQTILVSSSF